MCRKRIQHPASPGSPTPRCLDRRTARGCRRPKPVSGPHVVQRLLENCTSVKTKRLFMQAVDSTRNTTWSLLTRFRDRRSHGATRCVWSPGRPADPVHSSLSGGDPFTTRNDRRGPAGDRRESSALRRTDPATRRAATQIASAHRPHAAPARGAGRAKTGPLVGGGCRSLTRPARTAPVSLPRARTSGRTASGTERGG